jgi:small-conductance mechanosensitive channel
MAVLAAAPMFLLDCRYHLSSMKIISISLFVAVFFVPWGAVAPAWDSNQVPPGFSVADPGAPVELEGKQLFRVRINYKMYTAEQRAQKISREVLALARDPFFRPDSITVKDTEMSTDIMVGDKVIVPVWDFAAQVEGRSAEEMAQDYADRIRQAIRQYQQEHSLTNLLYGIAKTILAFLILIALIFLLNRGVRRLNQAILATQKIHALKFESVEFFTADRIKAMVIQAVKILRAILILFLLYAYLHLGLSFFPATQQLALNFYHNLLSAFSIIGNAIWDQTPSLAFLVVLYFIARYALKTLRFFFEQIATGKVTVAGLDAEVAPITYRIFKILIIVFFLVMAYPYIPGSDSPAFKGISIFLGVLFSLGSSSAIANLIAGVALTYQRSFRVGDVIKVGEVTGMVVERRLNVSRIRTWKNEIVTISNNTVLNSHVINLSQQVREGEGLILHTSVTIGYDAPWETVHNLLITAAKATADILPTPPPFVLQTALNDFYVSYELNAYTDRPEIIPRIYSELHQHIQDKFNQGAVEIMSPHYTNLRDGNKTTIPDNYLPADYDAPGLRFTDVPQNGKKLA